MRASLKQIRIYTAFILIAIVIGQCVWIYNMDQAYRVQFYATLSQSIEAAILKEVSYRDEQEGGTIVYAPLTASTDTSRYVTKTIRTADTSFRVTYDRHDPHSRTKLLQFMLKEGLPVNVNALDSLFREELMGRRFPLAETAIEYLDLKFNKVLNRSDSESGSKTRWLSTDVIPLDIFNTIGIRAYAQVPALSVLQRMAFQLVLSFILISICMFFLFVVIRSFFFKKSTGKIKFEVPDDTEYLWLVVMGAPSEHWPVTAGRQRTEGTNIQEEQWPYEIKLAGTAVSNSVIQ